ncbi:MAG: PLP-dependent aminotransferase family protein [Hyphomicrobiaceae bacterium]|nr:PLP-dependent aminotransferase family protein [Hyphomicrobiaceae bacterium]
MPTIEGRRGPAYQRIVDALADDIAAGRVHQGQRLPTHRALAIALGLDVTTVTRAYAEARRLQLVDAQTGRGTFVAATASGIWRATSAPAIDLSMILPPQPDGADLDARLAATLAEIRRQAGFGPYLVYQQPGGSASERAVAALWLSERIPSLTRDRVLIAPGTQTALMALLLDLAAPGDTVLTEALTYPGLKAAAAAARLTLVGVEMDSEGVRPDALEAACQRHKSKLIVLTPTMQNPTTATMRPPRRARIADIIAKRQLTLVEDDPYVPLDPAVQPLAALIPERSYLAISLSKCIAPGLRTSLLVLPSTEATQRVTAALRAVAQMPTPLLTAIAIRWLQNGSADAIISSVRGEAAARQTICREVLGNGRFATQANSPHIWLPAPGAWSSERFSSLLRSRGLGVVASDAFAVGPDAPNGIRAALGAARNRAELKAALEILRDAVGVGAGEAVLGV